MFFYWFLPIILMPFGGKFSRQCCNPKHNEWCTQHPCECKLIDAGHIKKSELHVFRYLMGNPSKITRKKYFCNFCIQHVSNLTTSGKRHLGIPPENGPLPKRLPVKRAIIIENHDEDVVDPKQPRLPSPSHSDIDSSETSDPPAAAESDSSIYGYLMQMKGAIANRLQGYVTSLHSRISSLCDHVTLKDNQVGDLEESNISLQQQVQQLQSENARLQRERMDMLQTQGNRIKLVRDVISQERDYLLDDIVKNKTCKDKLSLENLVALDPNDIINRQNPVLSAAIDEFTKSTTEQGNGIYNSNDNLTRKKNFKRALIGECILGTADLNYISPLAFAPLLLAHGNTGSRTNCEILSQLIPCGSYTNLHQILSEGLEPPDPAPVHSDVAYAFDNNQRILRTWLSRNNNKQVIEIMTNILRFSLDTCKPCIQFRYESHPNSWLQLQSLTNRDFHLNFCEISDPEIIDQLNVTLAPLLEKMTKVPDNISEALEKDAVSANTIVCPKCNTSYVRSKLKCNICQVFIRQEIASANKIDFLSTKITPQQREKNSDNLKFHNYLPNENGFLSEIKSSEDISNSVDSPFTLIDPLFVNPASLLAVEKVLEHIGKDAGIKALGYGNREWTFVACDGSPMNLVLRLISEKPEQFGWVVPVVGIGHEEMNMVRSFVEMSWDFIYKDFCVSQGYKTPKSLDFAKRCSDHHIAFDNLRKFREAIWTELFLLFLKSQTNVTEISLITFFSWIASFKDGTLNFLVHYVLRYLEGIFIWVSGVADSDKWQSVIRNHSSFCKLRKTIHALLSIPLPESSPRPVPSYTKERDEFRKTLRKSLFLEPIHNRTIDSLDSKLEMCQNIHNFRRDSIERATNLLDVFIHSNCKYPLKRTNQRKIPLSQNEKNNFEKDSNRTKIELLAMIEENVRLMGECEKDEWMNRMKRENVRKATKPLLLDFLAEVREHVNVSNLEESD